MNEQLIETLAYATQEAYLEHNNRETAILYILEQMPDADVDTLRIMWSAIDAYVDINS